MWQKGERTNRKICLGAGREHWNRCWRLPGALAAPIPSKHWVFMQGLECERSSDVFAGFQLPASGIPQLPPGIAAEWNLSVPFKELKDVKPPLDSVLQQ